MPTNLSPKSQTSAIILPKTGSASSVAAAVPFGIYTGSVDFLSGASMQVAYVYKKLGGDVVDIELTAQNVYAAYEEGVLEYSYILNLHQGKNMLSDALGNTTGTFDHKGDIKTGPSGSNLKFQRFQMAYAKRVGDGLSSIAGFGGSVPQYSASFKAVENKQDYNIQSIISSSSLSGVDDRGTPVGYAGKVTNQRIYVTKVFYRSPRATWRFYGYYGGINVVGNYSTYGQFADDSTFEIIPTWQNKMQAIMYEDSIFTRTSHYSYELIDNMLRLFPNPSYWGFSEQTRIWVKFYVKPDAWEEYSTIDDGISGVNNLNTLPYDNVPYKNINAIGKQWIRKYTLALCKEMLGQIRGKFQTIPIPGDSVTLNHADLLSQAKEEQTQLKDKLMEILKETEYLQLAKQDSEKAESAATTFKNSPLPIFVG
ncbi:hypothetical protein CMI37_11375 [Candidatus Pacearchaeota archaeon]|nr:hypothetical protein [Candidatus Pacearchaeota archaeon]